MLMDLIPNVLKFPQVEIELNPINPRVKLLDPINNEQLLIYSNNESISVKVKITPNDISDFEYLYINLNLIGEISCNNLDEKYTFLNLFSCLSNEGIINKQMEFRYTFPNLNLKYESYIGINFNINYYIVVNIKRKFIKNYSKQFRKRFIVQNISLAPLINGNCRMEIGVNDLLHLEYELFQTKFHLNDVITGKLYFILVISKIKNIEIQIIKKEKLNVGKNSIFDSQIIGRLEICDGHPYENEMIPFRMQLNGKAITPTIKRVADFSVTYFFKILVILNNDKMLFKNQEITFWRKEYC